jgi:peptidoglycan/LPS O-acetylase OafA/YrhL
MSHDTMDRSWRFRPDVEGLRAVAILLVIFYHAGWLAVRGGFIGVDVFFVLSGFLITGILVDEVDRTGRISLLRFWSRRSRRLLPAAAVVSLVTLAASARFTSVFEQVTVGRTAVAAALYASNLFFVREAGDYFASDLAGNPFLHTWSLAVEEQYYLVFAPLTALVAWWIGRRAPSGGFRRWFGWIILALTLLSFAACLAATQKSRVLAFYVLPTRAWELGIGCLLAVTRAPERVTPRGALGWIGVGALALLVGSATWIDQASAHPGLATLVPVLSTAVLVLIGGANAANPVGRALASAPMRTIGRLSYSWYLWHWPMFVFLKERVSHPSTLAYTGAAAASLGLAALTYVLVEGPIRFSAWLSGRPWYGVAGALGYSAVLAVGALSLKAHAGAILRRPELVPLLEARRELPAVYARGCHATGDQVAPPRLCVFGVPTGLTSVLLFGDSHAAQWMPALDRLADERRWRLVTLTKTGCPSVSVTVLTRAGRRYGQCDRWRAEALAAIREERPHLIIVSNAHDYRMVDHGRLLPALGRGALGAWERGMKRTLGALAAIAPRVVVIRDTPEFPGDPLSCLATHLGSAWSCAVHRRNAVDSMAAQVELNAAATAPPTAVLDMTDEICTSSECPAEEDGMPIYRDSNHLSVRFSKYLAGSLGRALDSLTAPRP